MQLEGTAAVITGGGNGIGRALALALARRGVAIGVADVEREAAERVAEEVRACGVAARGFAVDVRDAAAVERLAEESWAEFGSVALLFNNAGVLCSPRPLVATSADDVAWILSVNVQGVLNGVRAFAPRFVEAGRPARIVNTGSEHSLGVPHLFAGVYTASKHAVLGLSDVLRRELPEHVGVSVLCPGIVGTTLWRASERRPDELGGAIAVPEEGGAMMNDHGMSAEDVADHVLRAIEDDAFYIVTHPHAAAYAKERWEDVSAAFAAQAPRYDGDERYEVGNIVAKLTGGG